MVQYLSLSYSCDCLLPFQLFLQMGSEQAHNVIASNQYKNNLTTECVNILFCKIGHLFEENEICTRNIFMRKLSFEFKIRQVFTVDSFMGQINPGPR